MNTRSASTFLAVLFCSLVVMTAGCDDDDDGGTGPTPDEVPQQWQGVWEQTTTTSPCGDEPARLLLRSTTVDTVLVCPDQTHLFEQFDEYSDQCTETWNGRTLFLSCDGTTDFGECTIGFSAEVEVALDDDANSYAFTGHYDFTTSLECGDLFDRTCEELVGDAIRISDSIAGCDTMGTQPPLGEFSMTIEDSDGLPSLLLDERIVQVARSSGGAWTITGRNFPPGPTQSVVLTIPDDAPVGVPFTLSLGDAEPAATLVYTEERNDGMWSLVGFDGTLTLDRADDERILGALSGRGEMRDAAGAATDSVTVAGSFDLQVDTVVPPLRRAVRDRILGAVHRAIVGH
ncbi:MAG TPA: hypothetical protein VKA86_10580 [Candidatus Krumholzibacteria bacterium]|nr:hypothetical protein [Candidatus Krumholzibacteria bacterium]